MLSLLVAIPCRADLHPDLKARMEALAQELMNDKRTADVFMTELAIYHNNGDGLPGSPVCAAQAAARNKLLERALRDHDLVLWIDADLTDYPPDLAVQLWEANPGGITAPAVLIEPYRRGRVMRDGQGSSFASDEGELVDSQQFYDTFGYIENGQRISAWPPYFRSELDVVPLEAVGCCYVVPAWIYAHQRYQPTPGHTEHWSVMAEARARGIPVRCARKVVARHAFLPGYGEGWH